MQNQLPQADKNIGKLIMATVIIYEPRGRAKEYSELAANLYRGCGHCCSYCYAPAALRMDKQSFCEPSVRPNVLNRLEKDAKYLEQNNDKRTILLSFTTDPYQPLDVTEQLTRNAIKILHEHNLKISILTKGGQRSERDFDLLEAKPELSEYGASLIFADENLRREIEPYAASTVERIDALKKAHDRGIFTYVSLEPVWSPEETLNLIDQVYEFVDFFKVGKLNHHPQAQNVQWKEFREAVEIKLKNYKRDYYIKKDLQKY